MSRLPPAPGFEAHFGPDASEVLQVYAHAPGIAKAMLGYAEAVAKATTLPPRLLELLRLRVAFHNQCRSCMALRYQTAIDDGVTEDLVCSLEKPYEAPDLSEAERTAIAFADRMATDHLSINDQTFQNLRRHYSDAHVMEICFRVASFVGFGRMKAVLDFVPEDLPERFAKSGVVTPWGEGPVMHMNEVRL
jgi:AhpD family alkylhydroperoxidase